MASVGSGMGPAAKYFRKSGLKKWYVGIPGGNIGTVGDAEADSVLADFALAVLSAPLVETGVFAE